MKNKKLTTLREYQTKARWFIRYVKMVAIFRFRMESLQFVVAACKPALKHRFLILNTLPDVDLFLLYQLIYFVINI